MPPKLFFTLPFPPSTKASCWASRSTVPLEAQIHCCSIYGLIIKDEEVIQLNSFKFDLLTMPNFFFFFERQGLARHTLIFASDSSVLGLKVHVSTPTPNLQSLPSSLPRSLAFWKKKFTHPQAYFCTSKALYRSSEALYKGSTIKIGQMLEGARWTKFLLTF